MLTQTRPNAQTWRANTRVITLSLIWLAACSGSDTPATQNLLAQQGTGGFSQTQSSATGGVLGTGGTNVIISPAGTVTTGGATSQTTSDASVPVTGSGDFCDALAVVQNSCQGCHAASPLYGAPMPLVTYEDFTAPAVSDPSKLVYEMISTRIHNTTTPMPPLPATLSDTDMAALDSWINAGAPAPATDCASTMDTTTDAGMPTGSEWPADCEDIYELRTSDPNDSTKPYKIGANQELHPSFYFDAPWGTDEVQVLASHPIVDDAKVLHHWILYDNSTAGGNKFLIGWAPGRGSTVPLPDDVGIYMPNGSQAIRLDVHYYNLGNSQDEYDQSGVALCVTRTFRQYSATVIGLTGDATAPANSRVDNVTTCTASTTAPVYFLSVQPHMHKLGVNSALQQTHNGVMTVLHDGPFVFEEQREYPLDNVLISNGDQLTTICSYQNDTNTTVRFGQNSDDEMCFNFVMYYPKGAISCGLSL